MNSIANPSLPQDNRSFRDSSLIFDLPTLIETMKQSSTWTQGELKEMILLKKPDKQIVLAALHEATEIKFFPSNDSITFQIIEGKIKIQSREEYITLNRGQILTFHKNLTLILTTKEETVFLLTIANGALQKSVN